MYFIKAERKGAKIGKDAEKAKKEENAKTQRSKAANKSKTGGSRGASLELSAVQPARTAP
jgi:hypothetical protein